MPVVTKRTSYLAFCVALLVSTMGMKCNSQTSNVKTADEGAQLAHLNLLGFKPTHSKVAVTPAAPGRHFEIKNRESREVVFQGQFTDAKPWEEANGKFSIADFSALSLPGNYELIIAGGNPIAFAINESIYAEPLKAAIRYYYLNRASAALEPRHAGPYARPASHPDTLVYVHQSAASIKRPEGTVISASKGWFDAGDFNKYVVNSAITVSTLLKALQDHSEYFAKLNLNIPESDNQLPDLLDEILWNLEWMVAMQDRDGGVYHKLTTKNFEPVVMPHSHYEPRYVVQKSTAATLDFASTLAFASRVLAQYETYLPGKAEHYRQRALQAWQWALDNPKQVFKQPDGFHTGIYVLGDDTYQDEWAWARAELFALTGDQSYLADMTQSSASVFQKVRPLEWGVVDALALLTIASAPKTASALKKKSLDALERSADSWVLEANSSGYGVAMKGNDFRWGSNAVALNKANVLLQLNQLLPKNDYVLTAQALLDYVLGRNPLGLSYVTGFGSHSVQYPHHRASEADKVLAPIPGMLVGGPHPGHQDQEDCKKHSGIVYDASVPAKAYVDHWCSWATNEVAINWNAALVYALSYFNRY